MLSLCLLLFPSSASATLPYWNPVHRPPVTLRQALDVAYRKLNGQGEVQFCASANLYGNKERDGREGAWNLSFVMTDGRVMHVFVDMNIAKDVTTEEWHHLHIANEPQPDSGRPRSLEDVAERLRIFFDEYAIYPDVTVRDGVLTVDHKVRPYQVYPTDNAGGYLTDLAGDEGPTRHGLWLRVMRADRHRNWTSDYDWRTSSGENPYWYTRRRTFYLSDLTPIAFAMRTAWDSRRMYPFVEEVVLPNSQRDIKTWLGAGILKSLDARDEWNSRYSLTAGWAREKKPSISLSRALHIAENAMADMKPDPYCLGSFGLWGDPRPDATLSAWRIRYVQDGTTTLNATVRMDGRVEVEKRPAESVNVDAWPQIVAKTISTEKTTFEVARERIEELFADVEPAATLRVVDKTLTLAFRTRQFKAYAHDGEEYGSRLLVTDGPLSDGIWARIELIADMEGDSREIAGVDASLLYKSSSYWQVRRGLIHTSDAGQLFRVEIRYGRQADDLAWKIIQVLGRGFRF